MATQYDRQVWGLLMSEFKNEYGVAGIMGNLEGESSMIPYRVQGDFSPGYEVSASYTNRINSGAVSRTEFVKGGPPGYATGYGLAQWSAPPRKGGLYDRHISQGIRIDSVNLQIGYLIQEIGYPGFSDVDTAIRTATNIEDPTRIFLYKFEAPADPGATYPYRLRYAKDFYARFAGTPIGGDFDLILMKASKRRKRWLQ